MHAQMVGLVRGLTEGQDQLVSRLNRIESERTSQPEVGAQNPNAMFGQVPLHNVTSQAPPLTKSSPVQSASVDAGVDDHPAGASSVWRATT